MDRRQGRPSDLLRKSHWHRSKKDYDRGSLKKEDREWLKEKDKLRDEQKRNS